MISTNVTFHRPTIREIYLGFCAFSVFRDLLTHPLFTHFIAYARTTAHKDDHLQLCEYGAFVGEVYRLGGNLASAVRELVFGSENVYVARLTAGEAIDEHLAITVASELSILSDFASLTPEEFRKDLGYAGYLPTFASEELTNLLAEYDERVGSTGKP